MYLQCGMLVYNGARCVHIDEPYAVKHVQNMSEDYLSCILGKCCEFHVICPCNVREMQNLHHSLYICGVLWIDS